jgi:3-hydroxyacyl-[acyl-carrier-protein] dehydratase
MPELANTNNPPAAPNIVTQPSTPPPPESPEDALRNLLKRCSNATVEAALQFRASRSPALLPPIVVGIIERFTEPDLRAKLHDTNPDDTRLVEDLGIDSLTMMEIVITVEEVLQVQIRNEELRDLRTIGDVKLFADCKLRGLPLPKPARFLPFEEIVSLMPIQPPFLFLNEAKVGGGAPVTNPAGASSGLPAEGKYRITGAEFFFQGHFKDNPVMPASMMIEALGQLAVLALLAGALPPEPGAEPSAPPRAVDPASIFFTSSDGVRCHRVCKPGDVLHLAVRPKRARMPLATFEGSIRVGTEKAVIVEEFTLTYAYAPAVPPAPPAPAAPPAAAATPPPPAPAAPATSA